MKTKNNSPKSNNRQIKSQKSINLTLKYFIGLFLILLVSLNIFSKQQQKVSINAIGGGVAATNNKNAGTVSTKTTIKNSTANTKPVENKDRTMSSGRCETDNCVDKEAKNKYSETASNIAVIVKSAVGIDPFKNDRQLTNNTTKTDQFSSRLSATSNSEEVYNGTNLENRRSSDAAGNQLETSVRTSNNPDGTITTQTTQVTTNPDTGNSSTTITLVKKTADGNVVTETSATSTRTRNEDGSYSTVVIDNRGNETFNSATANGSTNQENHKDSRDIDTSNKGSNAVTSTSNNSNVNASLGDANIPTPVTITCSNGEKLVDTHAGLKCANPNAQNCDNLGMNINGKCYMIGDKTSDGFEVCDWTLGSREGIKYPYQSKNCPTKTVQVSTEPKSAVECGLQGWWNDKENNGKGKCIKVGEQISNSDLVVCKGGATSEGYKFNRPYNSKKSECPDFSSANLAIPVNPNETNLGNTISTPTIDPKDAAYDLPPAFQEPPAAPLNTNDTSIDRNIKQAKKCYLSILSCNSNETCVGSHWPKQGECVLKSTSSLVSNESTPTTINESLKSTDSSCWSDRECASNKCTWAKGAVDAPFKACEGSNSKIFCTMGTSICVDNRVKICGNGTYAASTNCTNQNKTCIESGDVASCE